MAAQAPAVEVSESSAAVARDSRAIKKVFGVKLPTFVAIAAGAIALLTIVGLLVISIIPKTLTVDSAQNFLINARDVTSFQAVDVTPQPLTPTNFEFPDDVCDSATNFNANLETGSIWATSGFTKSRDHSFWLFSEIVKFSTQVQAQSLLNDLAAVATDDACNDAITVYSGGAMVKNDYGVNVEGVETGSITLDYVRGYGSVQHFIAARRGTILLVLHTIHTDTSSLGFGPVKDIITTALNRFAGN